MKKYIIKYSVNVLLIILIFSITVYGQEKKNTSNHKFKKENLFTGGGLGLQFGTVTLIDISPILGYRINDNIAVGIGATYKYYKDNNYNFSTDIYGGNVFARYYIFDNIFAHAEYEILSIESNLYDPRITQNVKRVIVSSFLVGGGYRQCIAGNSFINLSILWNLNESIYSPYDNPVIRIGVDVGL